MYVRDSKRCQTEHRMYSLGETRRSNPNRMSANIVRGVKIKRHKAKLPVIAIISDCVKEVTNLEVRDEYITK